MHTHAPHATPHASAALLLLLSALALFSSFAPSARAQAAAQKEAPATVTGRVTDGDQGVPGITVMLLNPDPSTRFRAVARAKTDAEGHYRITGAQPGRYQVTTFAPAHVVHGMNDWPPGRPLSLTAGETVENIDFRVERAGVITGKVTDADGNPVIAEQVSVMPVQIDASMQNRRPGIAYDSRDHATDDRGIYRIYGLTPGRYRVSVGRDDNSFRVSRGKIYKRTFYPSVTEESEAKIVEVAAGGEVTDVDITLGAAEKTFRASGLFIDAVTGQPVGNVPFGYGMIGRENRLMGDYSGGATSARGEFQTVGLAPGRYSVFAYPREDSDFYSESATFEVTDSDVSGVVVKLRRGATVSGSVVLEGVSDRAAAARVLKQLRVYGYLESRTDLRPNFLRPPSVVDGAFTFKGVRPGKLRIMPDTSVKGVMFLRLEQGGVALRDNLLEVAEGASVTGVRVVVTYGNALIRGQINFINGELPPGTRVMVSVRRVTGGGEQEGGRQTEADTRGRFSLEGLAPGEYELRAHAFSGSGRFYRSEPQRVSVGESGEQAVTFTLDLSAPVQRGGGRP